MECRPAGTNSIDGSFAYCGHHCAHFGEPELQDIRDWDDEKKAYVNIGKQCTELVICQGKRLYFDEFTDERVSPEPPEEG